MEYKEALQLIERGVQMIVTDKFADVCLQSENAPQCRAQIISLIGRALGETWEICEYPIHWKRFSKRKDCPQYMKETRVLKVSAFYPKLSFPEQSHWVSFT